MSVKTRDTMHFIIFIVIITKPTKTNRLYLYGNNFFVNMTPPQEEYSHPVESK